MAMRALWRGELGIGAANVPVKLYTAVAETDRVHFEMLHDVDKVRLQQRMVCSADGEVVPPEHIVRGIRISKTKYVPVPEEDLDALEPEGDRSVAVGPFVKPEDIDPRLFNKAYYLGPDEGGQQSYQALRAALAKSGRYGLCRWVMRKRHYTGILQARDDVLCLVTLHAAKELVAAAVDGKPVALDARELKTASYLVEAFAGDFDHARYADDYQQELRALIQKKAAGKKVKSRKEPAKTKTTDSGQLLTLLEASLKKATAGKAAKPAAKKAARKAAG